MAYIYRSDLLPNSGIPKKKPAIYCTLPFFIAMVGREV